MRGVSNFPGVGPGNPLIVQKGMKHLCEIYGHKKAPYRPINAMRGASNFPGVGPGQPLIVQKAIFRMKHLCDIYVTANMDNQLVKILAS